MDSPAVFHLDTNPRAGTGRKQKKKFSWPVFTDLVDDVFFMFKYPLSLAHASFGQLKHVHTTVGIFRTFKRKLRGVLGLFIFSLVSGK